MAVVSPFLHRGRTVSVHGPPGVDAIDAMLDALKIIFIGAPLSEVLTSVARRVETQPAENVVLDFSSLNLSQPCEKSHFTVMSSTQRRSKKADGDVCIGHLLGKHVKLKKR